MHDNKQQQIMSCDGCAYCYYDNTVTDVNSNNNNNNVLQQQQQQPIASQMYHQTTPRVVQHPDVGTGGSGSGGGPTQFHVKFLFLFFQIL